MADTMHFELVSPERRLASGEAKSVRIPGSEGQMTALPDHAPVITALRPGVLRIETADGGAQEFAVTGGFAQVNAEGASILAERAYLRDAENRSEIEALLEEARAKAAAAPAETRDMSELMVADLAELLDRMV